MNNKVCIVTGGSSGIGEAIVNLLDSRGFYPIIFDTQKPKDKKAEFVKVDISDKKRLKRAVEQIGDKYKQVHSVVHSAGIYPSVHFDKYTDELWKRCFQVNVFGAYFLSCLAVPLMGKTDISYIIHISSEAAFIGSRDPGYSASKGAVEGLVKSLAKNLSGRNINVNSIAPGPIDTPMSRKGMRPEDVKKYKEKIPLKRFGEPEEIAKAVLFLISGEANYITGTTLHLSGGLYLG